MKNKQPLGLIPKRIRQNERYVEVCEAITRYYNNGQHIPIEWINEYNELVPMMKKLCDFSSGKMYNRLSEIAGYFESRFLQFLPIRKYDKTIKIKTNEIGMMYNCSIIFNPEYHDQSLD